MSELAATACQAISELKRSLMGHDIDLINVATDTNVGMKMEGIIITGPGEPLNSNGNDRTRPPKRPWEEMTQQSQWNIQNNVGPGMPRSGSGVESSMPDVKASKESDDSADDGPPQVGQAMALQDMEIIRVKRATTVAAAAASATTTHQKSKYRKRSVSTFSFPLVSASKNVDRDLRC
jgi:hypothetical protein